ncbi:hypothetical protein JCM5296_002895 [Sporobolomyces johnsonii]
MPPLKQLLLSWLSLAGPSRLLAAYPAPASSEPHLIAAQNVSATSDLEGWIKQEQMIAFEKVFANIGDRVGADAGVIIASPSLVDPDYFYTWTRDAALTAAGLLTVTADSALPVEGSENQTLSFLSEYIDAQLVLQTVTNPSSNGHPLSGLGDPKFYSNLTAFLGPWGRPQRDGPALRALATLKYIDRLNDTGIENKTMQLLEADLDYVVAYWNYTGFDLWEEVSGSSFFTTISHLHALSLGSDFFAQNGDQTRSQMYTDAAEQVQCFTQEYWLENDGYIVSNWNIENGVNRTGLDANSILATLLSPFDSAASSVSPSDPCDPSLFTPCSDRMLANHKAVVDSFRGLYAIEGEQQNGSAIAIGRYREDVYYTGNPWYLTTLAAAEQLYLALSTWETYGELNITETSLAFFQSVAGENSTVGTLKKGDDSFEKVTRAVFDYADAFVDVVRQYTPANGTLAEQFNKTDGVPTSARDLTWSYVAFLTAVHARSAYLSPPASLPSTSSVSLIKNSGTCPDGGTYNGTMEVEFSVDVNTTYGENILLSGSAPSLGAWNLSRAVSLSAENYTASNPVWILYTGSAGLMIISAGSFQT